MPGIETSLLCEADEGTFDPEMSFAEIEAELKKLTPDQLRQLALKSWTEFVARESRGESGNECNEEDPHLLAALDEAIEKAAGNPERGLSGNEVRARLSQWTSK